MTNVIEPFTDHTAPPGHLTFTVLDQMHAGHSVSIASEDYAGVVRATKSNLSDISAATVFAGATEIIRRSVGCADGGIRSEDDGLLYAFISALLKHPDKRSRRKLMAGIRTTVKKEGGAHVILIMPPTGPSAWMIAAPASNGQPQ